MARVENQLMDVMHVTEACGGGVRRHLKIIIPELINNGFKCGICGFGQRIDEEFEYDLLNFEKMGCKIDLHPFNHGNVCGVLGAMNHLKKLQQDWRPAVVHAHSSMAGFCCRAVKNSLNGLKLCYSPHAFALHPSLPWTVRRFMKFTEKMWAARTDAYVFVGRSEIQDANMLGLPAEKFHLIENSLPRDFRQRLYSREDARRALKLRDDTRYAVIPCRLARQKGLDQVLKAIAMLPEDETNLIFMFCGDGPEKNFLQTLASELGITNKVIFAGPIERLAQLLPAFDLTILPSLYEGLSYVLLECLAAAVPLVVSDIQANIPRPELRDIVQTFPLGDVEELAGKIRKCLRQPNWALARASQGVDFMEKNYGVDGQIQRLSTLYKLLMKDENAAKMPHRLTV